MSAPTMPLVFVDTNVLLYSFDESVPAKRDGARGWIATCWRNRCGRLSTQVLNEFYCNARKKFARVVSAGEARTAVRRYQQWKPWQIDQATVETAWAVETRTHINYWDALMVAAAQHLGCTVLLTEDLQRDQRIDKLRIVNPFVTGPELLDSM
jgi:predicted nucleic acid-binding protein